MQRTAPILALAVLLAAGAGCAATQLPPERPDDFTIEWREGGGMDPKGSSAVIAAGAGAWTFDTYDDATGRINEETFAFTVTDEEFDALYAVMRKSAVDTIRESDEPIYDGDNAGIELRWDDEYVSLWGMGVEERDEGRYTAAYEAIAAFLNAKVPDHP